MRKRWFIMIHHSLTADGQTVSWSAIRRYHTETNGWRDIGYHYGVELVGDGYEVLLGRAEDETAAACKEGRMNDLAIHVCLVGNFDLIAPPKPMLEVAIHRIIRPLMDRHALAPDRIVAHRDYAHYKSCPGTKFDMDAFRGMLA